MLSIYYRNNMDQSSIRNKNPGGLKNEVRDLPFQKKGFNGMTTHNALKMGKIVQKIMYTLGKIVNSFVAAFFWKFLKIYHN